jgi:transcription elongation factor SPT4
MSDEESGDESESLEDEPNAKMFNVPGQLKSTELLACRSCRIILAKKDWAMRKACPNCPFFTIRSEGFDDIVDEATINERVADGTTKDYDGHLAVCNPRASWAARYLQLQGGALPGVYALNVVEPVAEEGASESEDEPPSPLATAPKITKKTDNAGVVSIKTVIPPARVTSVKSTDADPFPSAWMFTEKGEFDFAKFKMRRPSTGGHLQDVLPEKLHKAKQMRDVTGPYGNMLRAVYAKEIAQQKMQIEKWRPVKNRLEAKVNRGEQLTEAEERELDAMKVVSTAN